MKTKDLLLEVAKIPTIEEKVNNAPTKEYVDLSDSDKADILSVQKIINTSNKLYKNNFLVVENKLSDIISFEKITDYENNTDYKSVGFICNIEKSLDSLNDFDEAYFNIKYKIDNKMETNGCSTKINNGSSFNIKASDALDYNNNKITNIRISVRLYPDKKYSDFSTSTADTTFCALKLSTPYNIISQTDIDMIKNCTISVYLKRRNYLLLDNTAEYTPEKEYNPSTKKYVDDKFLTGELETVLVIPVEELNKSNTNYGLKCNEQLNLINLKDGKNYYSQYGETTAKMTSIISTNYAYSGTIDTVNNNNINVYFDINNNTIGPCNTGISDVKNYKFINDLIIKRDILVDLKQVVQKDANKYILICNDDTLVINKTDITDLSDATITIDNLTGQFGTLVANDDGTYSYTLNTIMTDVETFIFKVNDVEQKLVIVPYREMIYDDKNAGITYDDKWTIEEDSKHYKGSAHKIENQIGTSTIIFNGTGVDVYTKISPMSGTSTIDIYKGIGSKKEDGKYKPSLYTNYIENNSDTIYYQQPTTSVKKLDFNTYTVEIIGGISNSTYYLDYIVIYNTLGSDLNDSIRKLYYGKDNSIGLLRTDIENPKFDPTRLYDPTTKKYVDDLVTANKTTICTDDEVNDMLNEVLGGDYSGN